MKPMSRNTLIKIICYLKGYRDLLTSAFRPPQSTIDIDKLIGVLEEAVIWSAHETKN